VIMRAYLSTELSAQGGVGQGVEKRDVTSDDVLQPRGAAIAFLNARSGRSTLTFAL